MKTFRFAWSFALVALASGCVFVPLPPHYTSGSRQNVTEQSTNSIQPGTDTVESVMLKFGEPDIVSLDERRIIYGSRKIIGELFIAADTDGGNGPDVSQFRFLTIYFDTNGVVTYKEFLKQLDN